MSRKTKNKRLKKQIKYLTKRVDQLSAERDEYWHYYIEARNRINDTLVQNQKQEKEIERLEKLNRRGK